MTERPEERLVRDVERLPEDIEGWGAYAGDYFAEKWDLAGDIERVTALLPIARAMAECVQTLRNITSGIDHYPTLMNGDNTDNLYRFIQSALGIVDERAAAALQALDSLGAAG